MIHKGALGAQIGPNDAQKKWQPLQIVKLDFPVHVSHVFFKETDVVFQ